MSLHHSPAPAERRNRYPFAILRAFTAAAGIGIVAGDANEARAAEPNTPVNVQPASGRPDVVLARAALLALDADNELHGVNLIVSIVDRVAVIGGPVSTMRQSKRAEEVVRAVPGISDVRNACFVSIGPDPLLRAVADRLGTSLPPRPVMFDLPGVLTGTMPPSSPFPSQGNSGALMAAANPGAATVVARRPAGETGLLGAPVGPVGSGSVPLATPGPSTAPGLLTGTVPVPVAPASVTEVLAAVGEMKKSEARFARLTVEQRDGTIVIGGAAPFASDAWDLAGKLQKVPGVARVVVGNVTGK